MPNKLVYFVGALALCVAQLALTPHTTQAQANTVKLVCESHDFRSLTCDTREPLFSIFLSEQLDRGGNCLQFPNMQFSNTGVTVNGGCRGRFIVTFQNPVPTFELACSSDRYQPRTCAAPAAQQSGKNIRALWLLTRDSKSPCIVGENVFATGNGIQVTGGCRGTFAYTLEP